MPGPLASAPNAGADRDVPRPPEDTSFPGRVEAVFASALVVLLAPLLNAILLAVLFWGVVSRGLLLGWLAVNLLVVGWRYTLAIWYRRTPVAARDPRRWAATFLLSLYASGAALGSAGVLLFPSGSLIHQVFLAFLMGGMVAGVVGAYSPLRRAFVPYSTFVALPVIVRLFVEGGTFGTAMALMSLLFYLLMMATGLQMHRLAVTSGSLRIENRLLKAQRLESLGVLAGGIAHDFNNLLAGILGRISLARAGAGDLETHLAEAEKAGERARGLTDQLLAFSKGGAPRKRPLRPEPLIEETARFALSGSKVRCVLDLAGDLPAVDGDEGQLVQALSNVLMNADQAMSDGGEVHVSAERAELGEGRPPLAPGTYIRIVVADDGPGIPPEHRSRVFDPWFTTKGEGTGLGLTTTYWIVRRHGGDVAIEDAPEGGTRVAIYLPAGRAEPGEATPDPEPAPPGRGRILVMDDERVVRDVVTEMLAALGYESDAVADGAAAARRYREELEAGHPYDAVVLDLTVVGGQGGRETMETLTALDPDVRGIVSSGYSDDEVLAKPAAFGFRGVIAKPFRMADLARVLGEVLPVAAAPGEEEPT
jgi:signal transduction histidine kinase/ActR/RegA family two-component response regulator